MEVETTPIEGLLILKPRVFEDARGFFFESYNEVTFRQLGIDFRWVQDNHAKSQMGTLRGLHFQLGKGQAKLARCARGRVWDVAVDIRPGSATFGQWHAAELTGENRLMMLIPEGFAHGYCVLSDEAEVLYKCSTVYDPALECEFAWNDPQVGVAWPIGDPLLSERDKNAQSFAAYLEKVKP
jgi:dTDP-4-dehydrorhamnose 3,5-epimerase